MPELAKTIIKDNTNLKVYFKFEGDATDSSGSGNNGTASGITYNTSYGKFAQGASFVIASKSNIATANIASSANQSFSVGFWVYLTVDIGTSDYVGYVSHATNGAGGWTIGIEGSAGGTNQIHFWTNTGGYLKSTTLTKDTWHHVVCTYDGTTKRIYLDGAHSTSAAGSYSAVTLPITLGRFWTDADQFYGTYYMDDCFFLNGTALTPDAIKELYEGRYVGELWPQTGLVGLWHLNGNSTDFSGGNNHGTDTAITYSLANGKLGQGAGFNGSSSKITIPDSNALDLTTNHTINLWLKFTALPTSGAIQNILCKYDSGGTYGAGGYDINVVESSGNIITRYFPYPASNIVQFTRTYSLNTYYMLTVSYDNSYLYIYLNGSLMSTTACTGAFTANTKPLEVGHFGSLNPTSELGRWFNGSIDEVSVWNRSLTANEIRKMYAWQVGKYCACN